MKITELILNESRNVQLSAWIQDVAGEYAPVEKRPAIVILPGGGYSMCSDREAEPVAAAFANAGFQAFILRYSVGDYKAWPNPLNDYEQAMALIADNAENWHVDTDRIAVVGFSAGGHLAACAATIAEHKPAAAILGYAALTKDICDFCQPGMPYPVDNVSFDTSPCFLFATRDDYVVDISNALAFEQKLAKHAIQFESHIYSHGTHGFSTGEDYLQQGTLCTRAKNWINDSIEWLGELWGKFRAAGFDQPIIKRALNGDHEPMLSLDCTVSHLKKQDENVQKLLSTQFAMIDGAIQKLFGGSDKAKAIFESYNMRILLQLLFGMSKESTEALEKELNQIKNII